MNREDYKCLPRATIGITTGFLKYYLLPPIEDRINLLIDKFVPSQEQIDQIIYERSIEDIT